MSRVALTFTGNPHNPLTDFEKWYWYDPIKAARVCSLYDRMSSLSYETSPAEQAAYREMVIDELCDINVYGYIEKFVEK